jgi:uncharacterized membrane protein
LIDGIFAVALTLLVLDIRLPENVVATSNGDLWVRLLALERHFVIYVVSFVVIGMYWINHHIQFHFVVKTNRTLIWINLTYLLLISFLPFATDLIGDHENLVLPCEIYGVTLIGLSTLSFLHVEYLERHPGLAAPEFTPLVAGLIKRRVALFVIVPLLATSVAFLDTHAALYVYLLLATVHFLPGRIDRHIADPQGVADNG